ATLAEVQRHGVPAILCAASVADDRAVRAMVLRCRDELGGLDVLVNNAGTTRFIEHTDLEALTGEVWDEILGVNLKGTFFCCRAAASELKKAGGAIVNVASIAAHRASGSSLAYAVSKAGVVQLTRALALALAPEVRVNSVSPGLVSSRWFSKSFGDEAAAAQEDAFAKATPVRKIASPDDVAQAVIALLENDVITGQDLVIDGGKNVLYQPLA